MARVWTKWHAEKNRFTTSKWQQVRLFNIAWKHFHFQRWQTGRYYDGLTQGPLSRSSGFQGFHSFLFFFLLLFERRIILQKPRVHHTSDFWMEYASKLNDPMANVVAVCDCLSTIWRMDDAKDLVVPWKYSIWLFQHMTSLTSPAHRVNPL